MNECCDRGVDYGVKVSRGESRRQYQRLSIEDLPQREKMRPRWIEVDRHHGLKFDALDGLLRKGLGRPWRKVYSEIVSYVKTHYSESAWHDLYDRIRYTVETRPMDVGDGQYVQASGRPFYRYTSKENFLVHPKTGLLMLAPEAWCNLRFERVQQDSRRWDTHLDQIVYDRGQMFRRIHGIWYGVELVDVPPNDEPWHYYKGKYWLPENDWLYKKNLYDVVLKVRLTSGLLHDLASVHGHNFCGKLISQSAYSQKVSQTLRSSWYTTTSPKLVGHEKYVYAKSIWQVKKSDFRRYGLLSGKKELKLPNIVR